MKEDNHVLLTVKEVSTLLRVQRPKVYELIKDGAISGFKVGADWRIRRDSVENLIGDIPQNFFQKDNANAQEEMEASQMSDQEEETMMIG